MGAVAGLLLGCGLLLLWLSATTPRPHLGARHSRLRDLLVQAGVGRTSPAVFTAGSLLLGATAFLLFLGASGAWPIALAFGVILGAAPYGLVSARARTRRTALREVWPEVVDTLVSSVRAGMSLPEALSSLAEQGPRAVSPEMRAFAVEYAATARFERCLDHLKDSFSDPVADRIIEALRLAHEVGGTDLTGLLRSLARMLREDLRTRGELEARQSWTVNGAKVAVAAPWLVLALLSTRDQSSHAYASAGGAIVLGAGALASVIAYRMMLWLGRLPEEERVLR